jgi:hypothetical protein
MASFAERFDPPWDNNWRGYPLITSVRGAHQQWAGTYREPRFRGTSGEVWVPSLFPRKVALGQHFRHYFARDVGQSEVAPLELEGQLGMVHA